MKISNEKFLKRSSLREREVMRGSESCSFPWRLALRSAAQGTNLKPSHHDNDDDDGGDDGGDDGDYNPGDGYGDDFENDPCGDGYFDDEHQVPGLSV